MTRYIEAESGRLTDSLLCDVEALLIRETNPPENKIHPAVEREGLEVTCTGTWPLFRATFKVQPTLGSLGALLGNWPPPKRELG